MKRHIFQSFFWFLFLMFSSGHPFAEPTWNAIQEYIVTFTPDIYVGTNYQPCQGVQVSSEILLTGIECTLAISAQLDKEVIIEALNSTRISVGQIRQLSINESNKGFLRLVPRERNVMGSQPYPALHNRPPASLKYAQGFHLPLTESTARIVPLIIVHHQSNDYHHYHLKTPVSLPPGPPSLIKAKWLAQWLLMEPV